MQGAFLQSLHPLPLRRYVTFEARQLQGNETWKPPLRNAQINLPLPGKASDTDKALIFHLARQYEEVSRKGPPMRHARKPASAEQHSGLGSRVLV